jgi:transcriptional regulator with XRE-family HTH domain
MSSALMRSIGRAARQARRVRKLTQEDVAERVGVSTQFYGRIERGYALPSVTTLRRMLEVLDLRADELLGALVTPSSGGPGAAGPGAAGPGEPGSSQAEDADAQLAQDLENPRLRRLMRFLRRASPETIEVVEVLLDAMDRAGALLRARGNAGGEPDPGPDDGEDAEDREEDEDDSDLSDEIDEDDLPDEIGGRDRSRRPAKDDQAGGQPDGEDDGEDDGGEGGRRA